MPNRDQSEPVLIAPRRLQSIDHTVRNSAETLMGVAEHVRDLPTVMSTLRKVTEDLSGERRLIAADRIKIELATGGVTRLEVKVDAGMTRLEAKVDAHHAAIQNRVDAEHIAQDLKVDTQHKAIQSQVQELRDWIKYAMGAAAAGAAVIGWLIAMHKL